MTQRRVKRRTQVTGIVLRVLLMIVVAGGLHAQSEKTRIRLIELTQ
jgi:hypothetical protein